MSNIWFYRDRDSNESPPGPTIEEVKAYVGSIKNVAKQIPSPHRRIEFLQEAENELRAVVDSGRIGDEAWDRLEARDLLDVLTRLRQEAEEVANYQEETKPDPPLGAVEDARVLSDGGGKNEDEEVSLPPREELVVQSDDSRRDIFDFYDLLKEDRKKIWPSRRGLYRAVADRKKENRTADVSVKSFMATEIERLYMSMKRTIENRGPKRVRVLPKGDMVLGAEDDEEAAKWFRDWVLELGDGCQPEWEAREPFS